MSAPRRILIVSDFQDEKPKAISVERRHWPKGFIRLGHDVQRFSFRNMVREEQGTRWFDSEEKAKTRADRILVEQIRHYHPDIVLISGMKHLDADTVTAMREAAPGAVFAGRDTSFPPTVNEARMAIARKLDLVLATNADRFLKEYKDAGVPRCAFIPCPCDPDIQRPYDVEEKYRVDIVFTGKAEHGDHDCDRDRYELAERLAGMPNAKVYGSFGQPAVYGIDCFYALSGAKITLSINALNDIRLYHSDRFINCLSCGAFVLAKRVPDTELLFEDGIHLKYFDTPEEFFELADHYLEHEDERKRIAQAGMHRAHEEFNCTRMAQRVLDVIDKGAHDDPWATIL